MPTSMGKCFQKHILVYRLAVYRESEQEVPSMLYPVHRRLKEIVKVGSADQI